MQIQNDQIVGQSRTPAYNLKAVVQETGLKADTLRAWERRYGIPSPQRTEGGHRLYSQYDIEMVKWLIARQEEGMSISRAVALWQGLAQEGKNPVARPPQAPVSVTTTLATPFEPVAHEKADNLDTMRQAWIQACVAFDEQQATQILSASFALYTVERVCIELLLKAMAQIGEGWYRGELTAQQEHFASALANRRLDALLTSTAPPTRRERVLVACPPEEEHTLVPLVISLLLRRRGLDVVYLGANVPVFSFEDTIASALPNLVILTAQRLHTAASLLEIAQLLALKKIPLAFGGRIFAILPALQNRIPGHYLGQDLAQVTGAVETLISARVDSPVVQEVSADYLAAAQHFGQRKAFIAAEVWRMASRYKIVQSHLHQANQSLSQGISAALILGDMAYMGADISWVEELLYNHNVPTEQLEIYLRIYADAANQHLDSPGEPVKQWLASLI